MDNNTEKFNDVHDIFEIDPCYEQHVVEIKKFYEEYLISILIQPIYEGFQSLYAKASSIEEKYVEITKQHPDKKNPEILTIFQTLLKSIPNLNNHKIRNEADRIKTSTNNAEIFDDLIKAVVKSNIVLMTYNVDHKRRDLIDTKYHENVIVHDFIHNCYVQAAKMFYRTPELFWHKFEPRIINENKNRSHAIIKESIIKAIKLLLPLKEILIEYLTHNYKQKDPVRYVNPHSKFNDNNPYLKYYLQSMNNNNNIIYGNDKHNNEHTSFMDLKQMINRDLDIKHNGDSILEDDININNDNNLSILLSDDSANNEYLHSTNHHTTNTNHNTHTNTTDNNNNADVDESTTNDIIHNSETSNSDKIDTKIVDISGIMQGSHKARNFFKENLKTINDNNNTNNISNNNNNNNNDNNNINDDNIDININNKDLVDDVLKTN